MKMIKSLKSIDMYRKVSKDQQKSTAVGGLLSIISIATITLLLITQLYHFIYLPKKSVFIIESNLASDRITGFINISFYSLPCHSIVFHYTDISKKHYPIPTLNRVALNSFGEIASEKYKNNLKFNVDYKEFICGTCYGAEMYEGQCCNTCEEVMEVYSKKRWKMPELETIEQCQNDIITDSTKGQGCMIFGILQLKKTPGDFHFKANMPWQPGSEKHFSAKHKIHSLFFNDGELKIIPKDSQDITAHIEGFYIKYYLKLIPTIDDSQKYYQYSSNYFPLDNGQIPEVKFFYDVDAVTSVYLTEKHLSRFLIEICAIIGGWSALMLFISKFLIE